MVIKMIMRKNDIKLVDEVLSWDPRGDDSEYKALEKANEAFDRITQELELQKKLVKELQAKYDQLIRVVTK
jgi:hypothetical protein